MEALAMRPHSRRAGSALLAAALLCTLACTNAGGAAAVSADSLVRDLYTPYVEGDGSGSAMVDDGVAVAAFSRALRDALDTSAACDAVTGEVGALGFDPIVDGQDFAIRDLRVETTAERAGEAATVVATFTNLDHRSTLSYALVWEDGGWRVDDIAATGEPQWGLRELLAAAEDCSEPSRPEATAPPSPAPAAT